MRRIALFLSLSGVLVACGSGGGDSNGEAVCDSGATQCAGNTFQTCTDGQWENSSQCLGLCDNGLGCVDCRPGTTFCDGNDVKMCDDQGNDIGVTDNCGDLFCSGGSCRDLCADAVEANSYIGCEYYAVDLDNAVETSSGSQNRPFLGACLLSPPGSVPITTDYCIDDADEDSNHGLCDGDGTCPVAGFSCVEDTFCGLDAQGSPFAIVVANPQNVDMDVTIENGAGQSMAVLVPTGEVMAIYPGDLGFTNPQIDRTARAQSAYKLSARGPFVAYQFNPLDNENVFSNDGSLLLPTHTWDSKYYAMTLPSLERRSPPAGIPPKHDYNGYLTVVGRTDATEITITPTADVRAGPTLPAIVAGTPTSFTLDAFDVLNLEAVANGDLTGTLVEATDPAKSYGVFSGHEAVVIGEECCADHIEEMMFPASTWGTSYAIARSKQRGTEVDTIRIIAQSDDTSVTVSDGSCPTLMAGGFCEIAIGGNLEISADKPIMVGQFLSSEGGNLGDPSMAIAVPTEQYRSQYSFLV